VTIAAVRVVAYPIWLRAVSPRGISGRVLATFRRSAYLQFGSRGPVLALVRPELGRGPLNVLVDGLPWERLQTGDPAYLTPTHLRVADWEGELQPASAWDPALPRLVPEATVVRRCLNWLAERAPPDSLAAVVPHLLGGFGPPLVDWQRKAQEGLAALLAGRTAVGCRVLCGLGPGLTPSGDDGLCGWMLALYVRGRPRADLLRAATATHRISRAFLSASARGHASESWHRFLASLRAPSWEAAVLAVLTTGGTSGADTLTGFLLGLSHLRG